MKNLFFSFLGVIIVAVLATSCNQRKIQPDLKISLKADTLIYQKVPVTAPRYSCETGDRLSQDKLIAVDSVPVLISLSKDTVISGKNLPAVVPPVKPAKAQKSGTGFDLSWLWPILSVSLGIVLLFIVLLALAYLLYKAFQTAFLNKGNKNQTSNQVAGPGTHVVPAPVNPGGGQNQQPTIQPNQTDIFNHQLNMAEGLIGNQPIHKIIQKSKGGSDGSWESEITIETKNDTKKEK